MSVLSELLRPPTPLKESEVKKIHAVYVTERRDIVEACGHKFYGEEQPKNNCAHCWAAFFFINGQIAALSDEIFQKEGKDMLIRVRGEKFTKWFLRFMAEIQKRKTEIDKQR